MSLSKPATNIPNATAAAKVGRVFLVTIDGIIGGGKSTFLANARAELVALGLEVVLCAEPAGEWARLIDGKPGTSILDEMYSGVDEFFATGRNNGAFALFQVNAFTSRARRMSIARREAAALLQVNPTKDVVILAERSIYSDRHIFKHMGVQSGLISPVQSVVYESMFSAWAEIAGESGADLAVYIDTTVDDAMLRIHKRMVENKERVSESKITTEYLKGLHARHQELFVDCEDKKFLGAPILRIDGARPFHACDETVRHLAMEIARDLGVATA